MVVLTPFYKVVNRAPYTLLVQHRDHRGSFLLHQGECVGLWADGVHRSVRVGVQGEHSHQFTSPIAYNFLHSTLFRLDNKYGGVFAEAVEAESGGGVLLILDR